MEKLKFSYAIDSVYQIIGRGIVVMGQIEQGEINQGDTVELTNNNTSIKTKCLRLEKFRKYVTNAKQGEWVAIVLSNVSRSDICSGMKLIIKE